MKIFLYFLLFLCFTISSNAQSANICGFEEIHRQRLSTDSKYKADVSESESFIREFVTKLKQNRNSIADNYTIPVVLHVVHKGNDGNMGMAQALSGMKIMNDDFNGLNHDFNDVDPAFESIKATLNINFCLATIDPDGNPTTGVIYYDQLDTTWNQNINYAWDNYKYFNIFFRKYVHDSLSLFTAYAYFPNTQDADNNTGGVHYSSIRWGYGPHSQLVEGQEWASVNTHEDGHWLALYHIFDGCDPGDEVDDTPPAFGGQIAPEGCNNLDFSCGVHTNGENYMDYNIECKKMFTQGQVDRMTAALHLPSRITLWQTENLIATGCYNPLATATSQLKTNIIFPNPAINKVNFKINKLPAKITIFDINGKKVFTDFVTEDNYQVDISNFTKGVYFSKIFTSNEVTQSKFIKH